MMVFDKIIKSKSKNEIRKKNNEEISYYNI